MPLQNKFRVCLLLDDMAVPAWVFQSIQTLRSSQVCEFAAVIVASCASTASNDKVFGFSIENEAGFLKNLTGNSLRWTYRKLIDRNPSLPDATELTDVSILFTGVELYSVSENIQITEVNLSDICDHRPIDLVIDFSVSGFQLEPLKSTLLGTWRVCHGDFTSARNRPIGFWESMLSLPETSSHLEISLGSGEVISLGRTSACTNAMSVRDNRSNALWKASALIPRTLEAIYSKGLESFFEKLPRSNVNARPQGQVVSVTPTTWSLTQLIASKILQKSRLLWKKRVFTEQWALRFALGETTIQPFSTYKSITPPRDRFWADPHVIEKDGKYFVFIEEFVQSIGRGHIALITIDADGNYSPPQKILSRSYHMSYPFVFSHGDDYFMVPETSENRTIELYKCIRFPDKWEFYRNLMTDVAAVDTTLFWKDQKWWMFVCLVNHEGISTWDELYIFTSNSLESGEWKAHPNNPVISDCTTARPAGRLFIENGELYRPSQDCSIRYGQGFNISKVKELSESEYSEEIVSRIRPNWGQNTVGTHSFSKAGKIQIIDSLIRRRR